MNHWKLHKLSEIIPKAISGEWGDDVGETKILRTTNFQNDGTINYSNVVTRSITQNKIDQKALKFGDTIIEKSGGSPSQPVGRVVYFDKKEDVFLCNNFTSVLRPSSTVDSKYVFWFLFNNHFTGKTLNYQNKTTGIINLKLERYLKELQIPLPPPATQKRIADILDKADTLRKKDRQLLQYYDDLAQSLFIDTFGDPIKNEKNWTLKKLGDVCKKITDGEHGTVKRLDSGKLYLMARNIRDNEIDLQDVAYISNEDNEKIVKRCNPQKGDLLLICVGATIGRACIVPESHESFSLARSVALLKPKNECLNSYYLYSVVKSSFMQSQIKKAGNSSAQAGLYTGKIKDMNIFMPPIVLQNDFGWQIKNIEQQKGKAKAQLQESENLFQTLLQQAFNGGLN